MSPDKFYGKRWEIACYDIWNTSNKAPTDRFWTATLIILLNLIVVFFVVAGFKKWSKEKRLQAELEEHLQTETEREL